MIVSIVKSFGQKWASWHPQMTLNYSLQMYWFFTATFKVAGPFSCVLFAVFGWKMQIKMWFILDLHTQKHVNEGCECMENPKPSALLCSASPVICPSLYCVVQCCPELSTHSVIDVKPCINVTFSWNTDLYTHTLVLEYCFYFRCLFPHTYWNQFPFLKNNSTTCLQT